MTPTRDRRTSDVRRVAVVAVIVGAVVGAVVLLLAALVLGAYGALLVLAVIYELTH